MLTIYIVNKTQGFLRVSVTVLGPGDLPPSHSHAEMVDDYNSFEALRQATKFGAEARVGLVSFFFAKTFVA